MLQERQFDIGPRQMAALGDQKGNSSRLSSLDERPDICAQIAASMPAFGEPRVNAAEVFTYCHVRVVDLCAGTAAETILHPAYRTTITMAGQRQLGWPVWRSRLKRMERARSSA
jgi:hypothetical protein